MSYQLLTQYHPTQVKRLHKKITLATIHASKGLEWDIVFFMNLHDDVFPSRKGDEDIICERRLFYVGVTRAKKGLYLTYSRQERSLSRFVREIPRPFLRFHNVSSFKLSTAEAQESVLSMEDMIRGLDGADWNDLRVKGDVPQLLSYRTESIYSFGKLFSIPEWVKAQDARETWLEMLRLITIRECALYQNKMEQLQTPEINETLLTLRIYKEDIEFWEQYEAELEHLVHTFLKHTHEMIAVEYAQLEHYVTTHMKHVEWSMQDMSHALLILAKIRGQLRPMRHAGFDLSEFSFGYVRNSVPTEMRPMVLASWHRMIDKTKKTHDILCDMWLLASLSSVIEGRNIPLYQYVSIQPHLRQKEQQEMIQAMEVAIPKWIITQENPTFHFMFEVDGIRPIAFDMMTEKCAYQIFFDPLHTPCMEDKILFLLKQYAYEELFDRALDSIGFMNMATGMIIKYEITATIREQLSHMWQHLQMKYNLYQEGLIHDGLN
jgi:hypothetical protein